MRVLEDCAAYSTGACMGHAATEEQLRCRGPAVVGGLGYGTDMISTTVARRLPVYGSVNAGKAATLARMGSELDWVRTVVWARFSGVKSGHLSKRQIRDRLMAEDAPAGFVVPQRLWRATVEDTVDKIRAFHQAVIATEVREKIYGHAGDDKAERKRLLVLARSGRWREDPWLSRQVQKKPSPAGRRGRGPRGGSWPTTALMTFHVTRRVRCGSRS
jgi:hypothetical protein